MAKYLTVVANMVAKPGKEKLVREELLSLVEPSRKDEGCISYDLHQAADKPELFYFHETWTSKELLDRHLEKPALQAVLGRVSKMLAQDPSITLWEKIS
jgi:quinol monooxygenase YgiN